MENKFLQITDTEFKSLKDERAIIHYISTNTIDRTRDIMNPQGMESADFEKARTVFFNHNYNQPIAKNTELTKEMNGVRAKTVFSSSKFADDVYNWHLEGIVNTWSIGFTAKREDVNIDDKTGIWTYNKWNLLEYSSAPLPANPDALDTAKSITKSIEGISMIELNSKAYELNEIIKTQSTELKEIKELIKGLNKTDNTDLKDEITKDFNKQIEDLKKLIDNNSSAFSGVKSELDKITININKLSDKNISDKELAKILTSELMKFTNEQILRAFLQVTGKEIKLN